VPVNPAADPRLAPLIPIAESFAAAHGLRVMKECEPAQQSLMLIWPMEKLRKSIMIQAAVHGYTISAIADETPLLRGLPEPGQRWLEETVGNLIIPETAQTQPAGTEAAESQPAPVQPENTWGEEQKAQLQVLLEKARQRLQDYWPAEFAPERDTGEAFIAQKVTPVLQEFAAGINGELCSPSPYRQTVTWNVGKTMFTVLLQIRIPDMTLHGYYLLCTGGLQQTHWLICPEVNRRVTEKWADAKELLQELLAAKAQLEEYAGIADPWDRARGAIHQQTWLRLRHWRTVYVAMSRVMTVSALGFFLTLFGYSFIARQAGFGEGQVFYEPMHWLLLAVFLLGSLALMPLFGPLKRLIWHEICTCANLIDAYALWYMLWAKTGEITSPPRDLTYVDVAELQGELTDKKPWWQIELSGAHLLGWVLFASIFFPKVYMRKLPGVETAIYVVLLGIILFFLKGGYWLLWSVSSTKTRGKLVDCYRWMGTGKGTIAVVGGAVIFGGLLYLLSRIV
jgi:hypothetical protein